MKHTLILLLLLPLFSFGQRHMDSSYGFFVMKDITNRIDTVPVLMLISDTAKHIHFGYNYNVYWTRGYCVNTHNSYNGSPAFFYLDQFKRPLRKTTVVWISKEY